MLVDREWLISANISGLFKLQELVKALRLLKQRCIYGRRVQLRIDKFLEKSSRKKYINLLWTQIRRIFNNFLDR